MKFGKECERVCLELQTRINVPVFPYKELKEVLDRCALDSEDPHREFGTVLAAKVHAVDDQWARAVRAVLRSQSRPLISELAAWLGLRSAASEEERQKCLAEWSEVARTGLRKIKKKFNKRLAGRCGPADTFPGMDRFAFLSSCERTEIESLAAGRSDLECPICLEVLAQPVAPPCGHAACAACFKDLKKKREGVRTVVVNGSTLLLMPKGSCASCPVCRAPVTNLRPMPALRRALLRAQGEPA